MKKIISVFLSLIFTVNTLYVMAAANNTVDWKTLYGAKMQEIISEYESGIRDDQDWLSMNPGSIYFSVQDINFDGIPELYHALCGLFELEPGVLGNEEIYYIKDGQVVKGVIEDNADFCLLPMYAGTKAEPGDVTATRWQYAMRNQLTGEVCFITNDSYSGFHDCPDRTYSKVLFDSKTGVLSAEVLLHQPQSSYTVPLYLQGYDYIGADGYNTLSGNGWQTDNWKPSYLAPTVTVNGQIVNFDAPPVITDNRTLVPIRRITEALGVNISWDEATRRVTMTKNDNTVTMVIGESKYYINGEEKAMDVNAQIMSNRTFVPARFVAEALGCSVDWDEENLTVIISEN